MSEAMTAVEKAALWPADVECWRLHYAWTLRHWFNRFTENEVEVRMMFDDRFVRMWRYYLAACEQTFRHGHQAVFQFQLSRKIDAVPVTRDYLYQSADRADAPAQQSALMSAPETSLAPRHRRGADIIPLPEPRHDRY